MSRALIHANIYLLPVIVLFIICRDVKKSLPSNLNTHFLIILVWKLIGLMLLESCTWIPEEAVWEGAAFFNWVSNILYLMLDAVFAFSWFIYIYSRIPGKEKIVEDRKRLLLLSVPVIIQWIMMLLTPWTQWIFFVNENNGYERGSLYVVPYLFTGCYMLTAIVFALISRKRVQRANERRECLLLAAYAMIPIAGLLLQLIDYKFWSAWPFTSLAILTIYVSIQNGQITTDGLTGLNNRRQLDQYLLSRCDSDDGRLWCLIILDVDDFKGINDAWGHIAGDRVLCRVAEVLKKAYGDTDAFLARFGGDEFAVVLNCESSEDARHMVQLFYDVLEEANRTSKDSCKLALSAGYACYDKIHVNDRHSLMMAADEAMYREKQLKKNQKWMPAQ